MSKRSIDFVSHWIDENVNPEPYPLANDIRAQELADRCAVDAAKQGISRKEIEEDEDLVDRMVEAMTEATDREINRLASQGD